MSVTIPRPEYPRPQFQRSEWQCLNGRWEFEIDAGDSGLERGMLGRPLASAINVPFCPESKLSGIEHVDFMAAVWYRRVVSIPESWMGRRILLHFQAVDYDATVWVDGREVARHRGGFTPFTADLGIVEKQEVTVVVRARDTHDQPQPRGKQSWKYENFACLYTRTTGIWQTVWMEPVSESRLERARITPDVARKRFVIEQPLRGVCPEGLTVEAVLSDIKGEVSRSAVVSDGSPSVLLEIEIPAERLALWSIEVPHLYDLRLRLIGPEGFIVDEVASYAGLRSIRIREKAVLLNDQTVFQRLVLDQGYYPDGLMTAPSDEDLVRDIRLAQEAGFNGARLHQKVFEERFLYHADRMGYIVWGEFADWGCGGFGPAGDHQKPGPSYVGEWIEAVERDYSHPSIVGWCPLNETFQRRSDRPTVLDDVTRALFSATKAIDRTRPVIDSSGYAHRVPETDIYDLHDYEQDPVKFAANYKGFNEGQPYFQPNGTQEQWSLPYRGQPFFVSEFGGIWWNPDARDGEDSWGYGDRPASLEAFHKRFEGLCNVLLENPLMFGYCYTQLTDVFQEQNGIYTFDRRPKFDLDRIRAVQVKTAAIERSEERVATRLVPAGA
ncbi:MAG: glycoside hydrolase family 2 TIM barrel-domain containing protein [Terrimicrobiaceae bacterium]|nr:glycoside hydrolase family 2 TIM barrel-domain containing protein [Terrimicrobiaceae bacterium]